MSVRETVPVLIETTEAVEPKRAFDFWRSTALARVDAAQLAPDLVFAASRRVALSKHGAILHTVSNPIGVERTAHHARADGRDDIAVVVLLQGTGYLEQGNNGGLLTAGDVAFHTMDQAFAIGSRDSYEEIRFQVPRATFLAQVGNPHAFAGRKLRATPLTGLFTGYLRAFSESVSGLSQAEAGIATEGILHLLRALADGQGERTDEDLSVEAVRALALAHIERRLHDPAFGPESLPAALRVSRSRLYAAFTGDEGVAAKIRDARLDRAYRRLATFGGGVRVASVMTSCGFTDAAVFSRAFRRRFGLAPRDLLAGRGG
ncbi:MAG: helix-turn-helix domain-containing protein [Parafilimonas terrae]|nr:helix-turn-helix domain-containing protein [Parafilimonas terrae]